VLQHKPSCCWLCIVNLLLLFTHCQPVAVGYALDWLCIASLLLLVMHFQPVVVGYALPQVRQRLNMVKPHPNRTKSKVVDKVWVGKQSGNAQQQVGNASLKVCLVCFGLV